MGTLLNRDWVFTKHFEQHNNVYNNWECTPIYCLFLCASRSPNNKHIFLGLRTKCAVTTGYPVTAGPLYPAAARGQPPPHHDREHHQGAVAYRDGQRCPGSFTGNDLLITITTWN